MQYDICYMIYYVLRKRRLDNLSTFKYLFWSTCDSARRQ